MKADIARVRKNSIKPSRLGGRNLLLCFSYQFARLGPDRSRNRDVLRDIEPPFLGLIFRHEGLPPTDARSKFHLRDPGILARLDKRREQGPVEFRIA